MASATLGLLVLVSIGCAGSVRYLPDVCVDPSSLGRAPGGKLSAREVKVYKGTPSRPFLVIGVMEHAREGAGQERIGHLIREMREQASRAGAHGLVNVRTREVTAVHTEDKGEGPSRTTQIWELRADAVIFVSEDETGSYLMPNCEPPEDDW